jgi:hypothetical protein
MDGDTIKVEDVYREGEWAMNTLPRKCATINTVGSFCDCIAGAEPVDVAARGFCERAKSDRNVTGDDLGELKKALMDLESDSLSGSSHGPSFRSGSHD